MTSALEGALWCISRGWGVFPLNGKKPRLYNWQNHGTLDPDVARRWFKAWPNTNYGVLIGYEALTFVRVVDTDPQGGYDGASDAEFPDTLTVQSGRRPNPGHHRYYSVPEAVRLKHDEYRTHLRHLGKAGVEFKGVGQYVVGPGSIHESSGEAYRVVRDAPIAPAPAWLLELAKRERVQEQRGPAKAGPGPSSADKTYRAVRLIEKILEEDGPAIQGQNGNGRIFKTAKQLQRLIACTADETLYFLQTYYNHHCDPPWSDEELVRIVRDVFRK